jgi:hypothetical protein
MAQIRMTKQRRTASARRARTDGAAAPLDLRDPDITRAKQLQRQPRRSTAVPADHRADLRTK